MQREKHDHDKNGRIRKLLSMQRLVPFLRDLLLTDRAVILVVLSLVVSILLTPSFNSSFPGYQLGEIAENNIKASRDFTVIDTEASLREQDRATVNAPVVYELDENVERQVVERLAAAFQTMRDKKAGGGECLSAPSTDEVSLDLVTPPPSRVESSSDEAIADRVKTKRACIDLLGIQLSDEVFSDLWDKGFGRDLEEKAAQMLAQILQQGVVSTKAWQLQERGKNLLIRKVVSREEFILPPPHAYLDIEEARKLSMTQALQSTEDIKEVRAIAYLASQLLQPNLTYNLDETERLKEQAFNAVKPVYVHVLKNEMIVREGQKIGHAELVKLKALGNDKPAPRFFLIFVAMFFFSAVCTWVVVFVSKEHMPSYKIQDQDFIFLATLLVFLLALARATVGMADVLGDTTVHMSGKTLIYAIPLSAGAMLVSIFFGVTVSLIFSLLATIYAAILFGRDFPLFMYFLIGSFVGAHAVIPCRNRMIPIKAGLFVGCSNAVLIVLGALLNDQLVLPRVMLNVVFGFCGGVFAGVLVTGLTPLVEMLFSYTTDIKLLELATMDQPLLQELMVQAPGTYHHSIIVGNMVEASAKSIGANSLLAKVAAYYHDIGKIKKPLYYIENQFECENRHEKLAPSMSSLILIAHVKDGVELATQHRLGKRIIDIIRQHHGRSFISYFFNKAVESREKCLCTKGGDLPPINVDDYRYPGPKPQTKEAGLVMLADVVEAACRSLTDPTPARIQGMVNRLINNIFIDGQLDECELTLKDLHQIAKHFNQILATVHHKRIDYPSPPLPSGESKGKTHAIDPAQRESKPDRDQPGVDQEVGKKDLKRIRVH
ncbi:MAG: HD family phosphohydrolase [Syntrophobacteraceae bacterium]